MSTHFASAGNVISSIVAGVGVSGGKAVSVASTVGVDVLGTVGGTFVALDVCDAVGVVFEQETIKKMNNMNRDRFLILIMMAHFYLIASFNSLYICQCAFQRNTLFPSLCKFGFDFVYPKNIHD
jgi:hypothetical protein